MSLKGFQKKNGTKISYSNPIETIKDVTSQTVKGSVKAVSDIGMGIVDQLFGYYQESNKKERKPQSEKESSLLKNEKTIFDFRRHHENVIVNEEIKKLLAIIKNELDLIKREGNELISNIKDIESQTINELPEKPGVYHVRFLEIILNLLKNLRKKISESSTWLQAMITRKKKRGSLFLYRAKKMGTQYSLSQELQVARNTQ
ncbi:MAG: DUF5660 domain-containing protein [Patescibacteria group bacterium]|nr:DUF5660 domain-containing protein [Patescibacteria group bacterium]